MDLLGMFGTDFDRALRGLLGAAAPLSAASIARLKASWQTEYDSWKRRRLDDLEPVYVWADGRPRGGEWVSGVDRELGGAAAGPQGPRVAGAAGGDRRRGSGGRW
jgi:hypothetical protein